MNDTILLLIGCGALIGLLVLILWVRLPAYVALLIAAVGVALATGIPMASIGDTLEANVGKTMGHLALIVPLGAMVGRLIAHSNGADALAAALIKRLGPARVLAILTCAALILGLPIFFEVGVVMLIPLAAGFAHATGRKLAALGVPLCVTLLIVHALLPPHPGAVAVAAALQVNMGRMLLFGLPIAAITAAFTVPLAHALALRQNGTEPALVRDEPGQPAHPAASLIAGLIALPIVLIMLRTWAVGESGLGYRILALIGTPAIALLIDALLCAWLLGARRGETRQSLSHLLASAIPDTAIIVLTTGAAGGFAAMLVQGGIGAAISTHLRAFDMPLLLLGFLITLVLRVAQGPTTVALLTTAGIIAPLIKGANLSENHLALLALAMGAGGMAASHVNDAGFWIVTRLTGLSVRQGLLSWTPATLCGAMVAFALIALSWTLT